MCLPFQPWYNSLEAMRYLLPDEDAKEKVVGISWQVSVCTGNQSQPNPALYMYALLAQHTQLWAPVLMWLSRAVVGTAVCNAMLSICRSL